MWSKPPSSDVRGYLATARAQVLASVEGLGEYDLRRPMTPTGTNLLGVVKHLTFIEAGYLGACLGRPWSHGVPASTADDPLADMYVTADETSSHVIEQYEAACRHSDAVLDEVGLDAPADVPWWDDWARHTRSSALLARVLTDTAMHAGQMQIVRELIDGRGGADQGELTAEQWAEHRGRLEQIAVAARETSS